MHQFSPVYIPANYWVEVKNGAAELIYIIHVPIIWWLLLLEVITVDFLKFSEELRCLKLCIEPNIHEC